MDYRRIFENLPGLFLLLEADADFTIAGASDVYLRAAFTTRDRIIGKPLFATFPDNPGDPSASGVTNLRASLERVLATRAADTMPLQKYDVQDESGEWVERYWNPVNAPLLDEEGNVALILHRVEDATALVRAAEHLRASEILESITEGFFSLGRDWRFEYVNPEATRILDRSAADLVGRTLWEAYPGLENTEFDRGYHRAMDHGEKTSFTDYYPAQRRWYEVTTYPAPRGIAVYFRDVTASKEADAERVRLVEEKESQERLYQAALSNTPDLLYIFDLDHKFTYANRALLTMWGLTWEEAKTKDWQGLGYEKWHSDMHDREIDQVIATREPVRGEVPFEGPLGRKIYDYILTPVLGPDGAVIAVAGATRDVTNRKRDEQAIRDQAQRLLEADRAKDDFLATLSHELRNPLAPLRSGLALLRANPRVLPEVDRIHVVMDRQVTHLARLVDDLLEMSRVTHGKLSLRKERLDLATVIRTAVETSEPLIRERRHDLRASLPDNPIVVDGDPVRIAQVISNILNNAAKYTDDGGWITLEAFARDDHAEVRVTDNGAGIASEVLPRIFDMFSRGEITSGHGKDGLGIGLALSRRLAEMHGGTLEASSAGRGQGTCLTFRVPLASTISVAPRSLSPGASIAGKRLLVVDDNEDAAEMLGLLLEQRGAVVRIAHSGKDALALVAPWQPELVLLDIGMPDMDGYEVAQAIRALAPEPQPVLVAVTGWAQERDRIASRDAGFDHHVVKPVDMDALQKLLGSTTL